MTLPITQPQRQPTWGQPRVALCTVCGGGGGRDFVVTGFCPSLLRPSPLFMPFSNHREKFSRAWQNLVKLSRLQEC